VTRGEVASASTRRHRLLACSRWGSQVTSDPERPKKAAARSCIDDINLSTICCQRHALLDVFYQTAGRFVANRDDIRPQYQMLTDSPLSQSAIFQSSLERSVGLPVSATVAELDNLSITEVSQLKELSAPWYSDHG